MSGYMSGLLNGKPCWSPSARTREYEFGPAATSETENQAILREAAQLVADAVRRGLARRADETTLTEEQAGAILDKATSGGLFRRRAPRKMRYCKCGELMGNRALKCTACWDRERQPRIRAPKPHKVRFCGCGVQLPTAWSQRCIDCSRPMRPCTACGTIFRPKEKSAKACSRTCLQTLLSQAQLARVKTTVKIPCMVCGIEFANYRKGKGPRKTCSMECKRKVAQLNARNFKAKK
jgi:hypothetical protein